MANLLYAENNIGCALDWSSQDYWYGRESYMSSYYADLEPNTTYTIKRIDTSTRFRLGLSAQDLKYLSSSSASSVTRPFAWTRQVDSSDAVTFTTNATAIHMVIYYTNNSEYNTRVMLNKGSSIEPYEAPTRYFKNHWRLINGELIYDGMPESIEYLTPPYPASMWRLDSDNDLVTLLFPEALDSFTPPYPATMWYLDENNKLKNSLLPEPYEEKHDIVHDDIGGKEYFNQHSGAYDNALKHLNNNYRLRLEILTDEETVIGEITKDLSLTAAGQITINYEQITRRSCSLSLINVYNKYIPTKNSPFWLNRKFKLWLGLVVGKDTYWWSQGIFYTVSANATGRILSIEGVDK
jgi:hypothetical protein